MNQMLFGIAMSLVVLAIAYLSIVLLVATQLSVLDQQPVERTLPMSAWRIVR